MAVLIDMNEWQVLQHIKSMFGELGFCHYYPSINTVAIGWMHTDGDCKLWYGDTWRQAYDRMASDEHLHDAIVKCRAKTPNENVGQWTTVVFEKEN